MNSNKDQREEIEDEEEDESLYEHHKFVAEVGQKPLRVDKYLMNFIENFDMVRKGLNGKR